ncbi:MAG: Trm112 family protein [Terrimicrobiaceae bacterium]|nr:Trm112 family protein [Terrimicrobiaceae bacterium]
MDAALLDLLCCPETHQPLRFATASELTALGIEAALIREDGRVAYPIRDGIPMLAVEEAIALR